MVCACGDGLAPPAFDQAVAVEDLLPPPPVSDGPLGMDGPGVGASCTTACDCSPGLACVAGTCQASKPAMYCCGTPACTGDELCQHPDGQVSQCSLPADAGVRQDAGSAAACTMTACGPGLAGDIFCRIACASVTGSCVASQGGSGATCAP